MAKPVGWRNESRRHSLASKGIKTAVAGKPVVTNNNICGYCGFQQEKCKCSYDEDGNFIIAEQKIDEPKKTFKVQHNIGKVKYAVSFHDGKNKHKDGSPFYDFRAFSNKKDLEKFKNNLKEKGYYER